MRTVKYCELNEEDISEIIAKHFGESLSNVELTVETQCVGYGMAEHYEEVILAKVTLTNSNREDESE